MSRYRQLQQTAPQPTIEGDSRFSAWNAKKDRAALGVGEYPLAINYRANRGVLETRGGTEMPVAMNPAGRTIYGSGLYNNPNGHETIIVAATVGGVPQVQQLRWDTAPWTVPVPPGTVFNGAIEFSQQFDKILLHRGDGFATLQWDGVSDTGFEVLTKSVPEANARVLLPSVSWSVNMDGRCIFPAAKDAIGVTDELDASMVDPVYGIYEVNAGTADPIVGAVPFPNNNLIIGKRRSIDVLTNFSGDITNPASADFANVSMEVLSSTIGFLARKAAKMVGGDLFFPSDTGVYRIGEIVQDRLQAGEVPVSDAIEPLYRRINGNAADKMVASVIGIYYVLFAPLDDSPVNNVALAYNTVTRAWEAYDSWADGAQMQVDDAWVSDFYGEPHIFAVNKATGSVHALYVATAASDTTATGAWEIATVFESRGYATLGWNASSQRASRRVEIGTRTSRPRTSVELLTEGANDRRDLTPAPVTRDRTRYYTFGQADYDASNVNGDWAAPGREDYSVLLPFYLGQEDVMPDLKQEKMLRFSLKARSRWASFRVTNTQGMCDITSVLFESTGVGNEQKRAA